MKRFGKILALALAIAMLTCANGAFALTAEEALGLTSTGDAATGMNYPTLQYGSRDGDDAGAYVVMLQNRLIGLGYLNGTADGQFGGTTESAVINFQSENGLTPTGIADGMTQSVLYSSDARQAPEQTANKDAGVQQVQQMLIAWGFMIGTADGVAGDTTKTAVATFKQYLYSVYPTLYAKYATPQPTAGPTLAPDQQAVVTDVLLSDKERLDATGGFDGEITPDVVGFATGENTFRVYQRLVQRGDTGDEVWRVQRRLRQLGYLYTPDGSAGALTEYALRAFQHKNGLPETGAADEATQNKLFSFDAMGTNEYVFPYKIRVNLTEQMVYIYGWDGEGYSNLLGSTPCSSGMSGYDTPTGTYQADGKVNSGPWYYFKDYNCYAKWAYRIVGGVMFHSVIYDSHKKGPTNASVNALGRKASHGCVRLPEDNADWIFHNCPAGTTVVIEY